MENSSSIVNAFGNVNDCFTVCRYYAAFPALHGQSASTNQSPSETIWRKNPLVKSLISLTSEEDMSSANEDTEIRRINIPCPVAIPKHRKPRKNSSRSRKEHHDQHRKRDKSGGVSGRNNRFQKGHTDKYEALSWPPGFAKQDPLILHSLNFMDETFIPAQTESPKRPQNEHCTKVESLLKGMLLPTPEKTYKDLQDVEDCSPVEMRQKMDNMITTPAVALSAVDSVSGGVDATTEDVNVPDTASDMINLLSLSPRGESVSPELQEQEIWYTQPIDVIFHSQDDDIVSNSKLRLYKRLSDPASSPDQDYCSTSDTNIECFHSSPSSPIGFSRHRSLSFASDNSDDIWESSVLIPAWLTDVISADENSDENLENVDLARSLKSSSPFPGSDSGLGLSKLADLSMSDDSFNLTNDKWKPVSETCYCTVEDFLGSQHLLLDDNCTPTPEDGYKYQQEAAGPAVRPVSESLVDRDYLSKFLPAEPDWQSHSPDDSFSSLNPRRTCITALWQSQVLCDYSLNMPSSLPDFAMPMYEFYDIHCWQPLGSSPFSQLWDVNMQKRSKISTWGGQVCHSDSQVWFAEKTLVFLQNVSGIDVGGLDYGENTLIPHISIDVVSDSDTEASSFLAEDDDEDESRVRYFDRSVSMGDVPSFWDDDLQRAPDPKLSKSFELVPSEHSAFNDVPRKLLHVHSEPNLVKFRQDFADASQTSAHSPQEHLYFSPKTHFRPITPAYVPELLPSISKQQVCQDLFGGLPSTKTPYQHYQVLDKDSDEEGFIPRFKVKNYSKSIQTGESFERVESPADSSETLERDTSTPETLTLSMIEGIMEEKIDQLVAISEDIDQDTANTDSAYETDYGGNDQQPSKCCYQSNGHSSDKNVGIMGSACVDNGLLGEMTNYTVQSFVATFPHTNDWPDLDLSLSTKQHETCWATDTEVENPLEAWPPSECPDACQAEETESSYPAQSHGPWGDDLGLDHLYRESEMEKYKNIWSSAGQDYYSVDIGITGSSSNTGGVDCLDEEYDNDSTEDYYMNMLVEAYDGKGFFDFEPVSGEEAGDPKVDHSIETLGDTETPFLTYAGFPDHEDVPPEMALTPDEDLVDYFSVKLVYKDKQLNESDLHQTQVSQQT